MIKSSLITGVPALISPGHNVACSRQIHWKLYGNTACAGTTGRWRGPCCVCQLTTSLLLEAAPTYQAATSAISDISSTSSTALYIKSLVELWLYRLTSQGACRHACPAVKGHRWQRHCLAPPHPHLHAMQHQTIQRLARSLSIRALLQGQSTRTCVFEFCLPEYGISSKVTR